jgi:riboflavin synthase
MFTGLVESLGTVIDRNSDGNGGAILTIQDAKIASELTIGESVAVNGACLTVVEHTTNSFQFQLGPETLLRTNLGQLQIGSKVNLERSLRVGDRLGGHFVQGHVDAVGEILERKPSGEWDDIWFSAPREMTALMVNKGSIAVDGISLTLVEVHSDRFRIMLIPHTLAMTTLGFKQVGDLVNLEADMLAKHVQKLISQFDSRISPQIM